jgi:hypothetical protein
MVKIHMILQGKDENWLAFNRSYPAIALHAILDDRSLAADTSCSMYSAL